MQVFTCTLTLGKEGEAQFIARKVGPIFLSLQIDENRNAKILKVANTER